MSVLNKEVTAFIAALNLPLEGEIRYLRELILQGHPALTENIKWNSPNFCLLSEDRITMKVQPGKQIQLVFHRGAKTIALPTKPLIDDPAGMLEWKTNDRAVATFKSREEILFKEKDLRRIVKAWLEVAS